jgi:hypothetical protein
MATNYKNKPTSPAKTSHTSNKLSRKSPYNIRSPKITPLTPLEMPSLMIELEIPTHSETLLPITPNLQASKKRFCISELVSPPKEGPGVPTECENLLETLPLISNHPVFSPGISEKSPTRTTFKATRKGKNKLVQVAFATENVSEDKGGCAKPPQQP